MERERPTTDAVFKALMGILCGYEAVALATREKLPTLSRLQARHPVIGTAIVAGLGFHFLRVRMSIRASCEISVTEGGER